MLVLAAPDGKLDVPYGNYRCIQASSNSRYNSANNELYSSISHSLNNGSNNNKDGSKQDWLLPTELFATDEADQTAYSNQHFSWKDENSNIRTSEAAQFVDTGDQSLHEG